MRMNKLLGKNSGKNALTVLFSIISIVYILPVLAVVLNSFKLNTFVKTNTFDLPNAESFAGFATRCREQQAGKTGTITAGVQCIIKMPLLKIMNWTSLMVQ